MLNTSNTTDGDRYGKKINKNHFADVWIHYVTVNENRTKKTLNIILSATNVLIYFCALHEADAGAEE